MLPVRGNPTLGIGRLFGYILTRVIRAPLGDLAPADRRRTGRTLCAAGASGRDNIQVGCGMPGPRTYDTGCGQQSNLHRESHSVPSNGKRDSRYLLTIQIITGGKQSREKSVESVDRREEVGQEILADPDSASPTQSPTVKKSKTI